MTRIADLLLTLDYNRTHSIEGHTVSRLDADIWRINGCLMRLDYALYAWGYMI